jgi:glycosyltransferase involved in cell wall biosynthesis
MICREHPPAPGGGIGTYVFNIARLFAESGETVHVLTQLWKGAEKSVEEKYSGRLIFHRIPFEDWTSLLRRKPSPFIKSKEARALFQSDFYPQSFAWQASLLAEKLIAQEEIDIIEGQDFEAPLYYLQLRRALGLGPKRRPPFLVHLHTPTEFVAQYNDWDMASPAVATAKRLEDYSIAAADALLCPSRFFASQAEVHYGLAKGSIRIIPHPIENFRALERENKVWEKGTICYVGRLERRKGVIEWIEAAIAVARAYPAARFEFVGANDLDTDRMTGEKLLKHLIPRDLKKRFLFNGQQEHSSLPKFLARARMAVVPSRWENFPYSCIEAMFSGLPVIASCQGGMVEMVQDGHTGWLAHNAEVDALSEALRRALDTPPTRIAEMGRNAASTIRQICDHKSSVENHLEFRRQVVNQGPNRSLHLPVKLLSARKSSVSRAVNRAVVKSSQQGLAIVVTCLKAEQSLEECLQSLERQIRKPTAVVVVNSGSNQGQSFETLDQVSQQGWQVIQTTYGDIVSAKNAGVEAVFSSGLNPIGFSFVSAQDSLQPNFVDACESVLRKCPEVGLVSCWAHHAHTPGNIWIRPCPSFPYQWLSNEAVSFSAIRTEALLDTGKFRQGMSDGYEDWDLFNAVMAAGWVAVTIPEILGSHNIKRESITHIARNHGHSRMLLELLERFPNQMAHDAKDIALLAGSLAGRMSGEDPFTCREHMEFLYMTFRHPSKTARAALWAFGQVEKRLQSRGIFRKTKSAFRRIAFR